MRILALPLHRPVGTAAVYTAVLLLGLGALGGLPLSLAPDTEEPSVVISVAWRDASPTLVEARVTSRIESEVERLDRVTEVSSVSGRGWAQVEARFEPGTRMDRMQTVLRDRLAALRSELPPDVGPPEVESVVPDELEQGQFFVLRAVGPETPQALQRALEDHLLPRLLSVPGISGGAVYGGPRAQVRVDLNPDDVAQGRIDAGRASLALAEVGGGVRAGTWQKGSQRVPVVWERPPADAGSIGARIVDRAGNRPVRLGEVADIRSGWEEPRRIARVDGRPAVQLVLEREPGSNVLGVAREVRRVLGESAGRLPPGIAIETLYDQSEQVRDELGALGQRAGLSVLAIFLVLVAVERRWRAAWVVLATLLFSGLAAFLLFRWAGLGLNLVTLAGIALAFGMAVDNSIVVLENARRRRGRGRIGSGGRSDSRDRLRTLAATREVLFPLLAATATTAVVLLPFLYLSGDLRRFYLPFVLSVGLSLGASLLVALTLTPLLSLWSFRAVAPGRRRGPEANAELPPGRRRAAAFYLATLGPGLRRPWLYALPAFLLFAGSVWVFREQVDRGAFFPPGADTGIRVGLVLPRGAEAGRTDGILSEFESRMLGHPYRGRGFIEQVETFVGDNRGSVHIRLHPAVTGSAIPQALKDELTEIAATLSGVDVSVSGYGPGFSSGRSQVSPSYSLRLRGPDFVRLDAITEDLGARLGRHARVRDIDTHVSGWSLDGEVVLGLVPNRERLDRLGISPRELTEALSPALAGDLSETTLRGPDGDLVARVRWGDGEPLDPADLGRSFLVDESGVRVPLGSLLTMEERPVQTEIRRRDQRYERSIAFEFRGPRRVGNRFVDSFVAGTELPAGYTLEEEAAIYLGRKQEEEILGALAFALVLVYLVSAALFESLLLPFVALLSVPLSFTGIAVLFWVTEEPFDRTAYVGLVLLAGIAINSALLLVHRAGHLLRRTGDPTAAVRRAVTERAQPILLTTATSVAGLVPLAVGSEPGAGDAWRALALSASAGLVASAFVTLWILPAIFVALCRLRARVRPPARRDPGLSSLRSKLEPTTLPG